MNIEIMKLPDGQVIIKSDDVEIDGLLFQLTLKKGTLFLLEMNYLNSLESDIHELLCLLNRK